MCVRKLQLVVCAIPEIWGCHWDWNFAGLVRRRLWDTSASSCASCLCEITSEVLIQSAIWHWNSTTTSGWVLAPHGSPYKLGCLSSVQGWGAPCTLWGCSKVNKLSGVQWTAHLNSVVDSFVVPKEYQSFKIPGVCSTPITVCLYDRNCLASLSSHCTTNHWVGCFWTGGWEEETPLWCHGDSWGLVMAPVITEYCTSLEFGPGHLFQVWSHPNGWWKWLHPL